MAFAVADEEQGRGIGTRLLEQLATRARRIGIHRFVADVMAENRQALAVFADAGFEVTQLFERGEVELRFPIEATEALRTEVEKRDHDAVVASLRPFFAPQIVAVVGASSRRGSIGGELFRNVLDAGFAGVVHPVNRGGNPVAGVRGYRSVEDIPDRVELAVICVPALQVLDAAEDALAAGVRALCVISSGFAEVGAEGGDRQEALLSLVRAHGARLVGPNCLGISSAAVGLNATFAPNALPPGRIGFSSQSGALGLALLEQAAERQLGFSSFVSVGNKADVSSNDLLEWWEDDEGTDAILLYLESFGNPRKFGRIARRVARRKPIIASEGRRDGCGCARCQLAYGGARRVGRCGRCALPAGGRDPRQDARGARRRRRAALDSTAAARSPGRCRDKRGRPGDPVRGCVRICRAASARARRRDTQ